MESVELVKNKWTSTITNLNWTQCWYNLPLRQSVQHWWGNLTTYRWDRAYSTGEGFWQLTVEKERTALVGELDNLPLRQSVQHWWGNLTTYRWERAYSTGGGTWQVTVEKERTVLVGELDNLPLRKSVQYWWGNLTSYRWERAYSTGGGAWQLTVETERTALVRDFDNLPLRRSVQYWWGNLTTYRWDRAYSTGGGTWQVTVETERTALVGKLDAIHTQHRAVDRWAVTDALVLARLAARGGRYRVWRRAALITRARGSRCCIRAFRRRSDVPLHVTVVQTVNAVIVQVAKWKSAAEEWRGVSFSSFWC